MYNWTAIIHLFNNDKIEPLLKWAFEGALIGTRDSGAIFLFALLRFTPGNEQFLEDVDKLNILPVLVK